jgi:L-2-hydroxycarboxylate dehydrogenase (NAD+)
MRGHDYALGRSQSENLKACIADILGQGNEACMLPGQIEAQSAALTDVHGGLLFTKAEIEGFAHITDELGETPWNIQNFKYINI